MSQFSEADHTTKLFMTGRGDPRAIFEPTYACNPDNSAETQVELRFITWQNQPTGGWICVRHAFDGSHEFRYYPPGNELTDVSRECIKVTLVARPSRSDPTTSTTVSTPASSTSTSTTSTTSTAPSSTGTNPPGLFADMTPLGFRFLGCAPEERRTVPFDFPGRTLPSLTQSSGTMTNAACMSFCSTAGYKHAGTEWSRECWCANGYAATRQPATTVASLANCNFVCSGAAGEFCGGDAWLSMYEKCEVGGPCENVVFA
jgi:kremen protein